MNAKLISVTVVLALLGSTTAFADQQRFGRDSVYANPASITYSSKSSAVAGNIRPGRSSVYVTDAPAPRPSAVANAAIVKPGRA